MTKNNCPQLPIKVNKESLHYGQQRSAIRELFDYGQIKAQEIGAENIYDFSIGNPSIPPPQEVTDTFIKLLNEVDPKKLHGYTSSAGDMAVRQNIAENLNKRYDSNYSGENLYMTCGAAAGLTSSFRALIQEGQENEFIVLAPYFPEYIPFIQGQQGKVVAVQPSIPDFGFDLAEVEEKITENTRAIVINSPNNPSGKLYTEDEIKALAELLEKKSKEYNQPIFIVTDEPYRELVYEGKETVHIPNFYPYTLLIYSYSKSLSIPGDRIGYVLVPPAFEQHEEVFAAVAGAARSMGYVCAPSLLQRVVGLCCDVKPNVEPYDINRKLLYEGLTEIGYEAVLPEGAFYLFMKVPADGNAEAFSNYLRDEYNILAVPSDSFGCPNYMRVSYCVDKTTIERGLPYFKEAFDNYNK